MILRVLWFLTFALVKSKGPYSQHFISFATYKWAQKARVITPRKPFQPSVTWHCNTLAHLVLQWVVKKKKRCEYDPWGKCKKTFYHGSLLPFYGNTTIIMYYKAILPLHLLWNGCKLLRYCFITLANQYPIPC